MSRELNKIFDVKSRQARRDILDKFDLSKEDKNKVLNKIDSGGGSDNGSGNKIKYYKITDSNINQTSAMLYVNAIKIKDANGNIVFGPVTFVAVASEILACVYISVKGVSDGKVFIVESLPEMLKLDGKDVPEGTFIEITEEEYWEGFSAE